MKCKNGFGRLALLAPELMHSQWLKLNNLFFWS